MLLAYLRSLTPVVEIMHRKIIFNASSINSCSTGIGQYSLNLLKELCSNEQVSEIICIYGYSFVSPDYIFEKAVNNVGGLPNKRIIFVEFLKKVYFVRELNLLFKKIRMDLKLKYFKNWQYIEPNYVSVASTLPVYPIVHDLSHIRCPEYHPGERVLWLNRNLPETLSRANKIFTVSNYSKDEICTHFNLPREKVVVASPGVNSAFHNQGREEDSNVLEKYRLKKGYLLYVGAIEPRKNLNSLVTAYLALPKKLRVKHPLVIAGPDGWRSEDMADTLATIASSDDIITLGYVPQDDMPALYSGAHAFAYPSHYEGFGMPLLEAMASGVPVLTSNCCSMQEIADGVGILVDPKDLSSVNLGLFELLTNDDLRQQLIEKGLRRSKEFTWNRTAESILAGLTTFAEAPSRFHRPSLQSS